MKYPLALAIAVVGLVILAFIAGSSGWFKSKPPTNGGSDNRTSPPPRVNQPERIRESLKPGKTYVTRAKGTVAFRGTDKDWGLEKVVTINYAFDSQVDREVESNDGATIVEVRHFRDIRSLRLDCRLEDVRINLGQSFDVFLGAVAVFDPASAGTVRAIQGVNLKPVLAGLRLGGISPEKLIGLEQEAKAFLVVDQLTGKSVRITYVDGKGVIKLENVRGKLTPLEEGFVRESVLVSDSLIFPNIKVQVGDRWSVSGQTLGNMIDPTMRATTGGEFVLEREKDRIVQDKNCAHLRIIEGRITFDGSTRDEGKIGHFDPKGTFDFSMEDQVVILSTANGSAVFEKFSKNHLLFESRSRNNPVLELNYTCRVVDTLNRK